MMVVNRDDGKMTAFETDVEYHPGQEKLEAERVTPEEKLARVNRSAWDNSLFQLFASQERAVKILDETKPFLEHLKDPQTGEIKIENIKLLPGNVQQDVFRNFRAANDYLQDLHKQVNSSFSKAYEYGTEHQKEILKEISEGLRKSTGGCKERSVCLFKRNARFHSCSQISGTCSRSLCNDGKVCSR